MANSPIPTVGLRNVGSYQISGHPFITGSALALNEEKQIQFPFVTKKITVIASGSQSDTGLRVHFNSRDDGHVYSVHGQGETALHFITLDSHEDSIEFDVKCKEIYVSSPGGTGGFRLYASLTTIPTSSMYALTGSGLTQ